MLFPYFTTKEDTTMAFPKDTAVTVVSVDDTTIHIQISGSTYPVDKGELANLMSGTLDDFETIKRNIAVALVLSGVVLTDDIAVKNAIEGRTFKAFR